MVAPTLQDPTPAAAPGTPPPVQPPTSSPVPPSPLHPSTHSPIPESPVPAPPPAAPPAPLPPLTPDESELLSSFIILRYDLVALAETNKLNPIELLTFARSPAVKAHLAELQKFADQAFALRSLESRTKAIDILEDVAKATDNHIERRRAASAILRGLNPIGGVRAGRTSGQPSNSRLDGLHDPAPRGSRPSGASRLHPPHRQAPASDAAEDDHPLDRHPPRDSSSPLHPSPAPLFTSSPVHPPSGDPTQSTLHHSPPITPSPNYSDRETAEVIGAALRSLTEDDLETLHAFTTPDTTLGEAKAPQARPAFNQILRTIIPSRAGADVILNRRRASDSSADYLCSLCPRESSLPFAQFIFTLTRSPDSNPPDCWLLSSFKRRPDPGNTG